MTFVLAGQRASVPSAPAISVGAIANTSLTVSLVSPSSESTFGVLGYDIEISTNGLLYTRVATVVDLPYLVSGLKKGTAYTVIARGVTAGPTPYRSNASNAVPATTTGSGGGSTLRTFTGHSVALSDDQMHTKPGDTRPFVGIPNGGTPDGKGSATGGTVSNAGPVSSGVVSLTIPFRWRDFDNGDGTFNWTALDYVVAQARGMSVAVWLKFIYRTFTGWNGNPLTDPLNPMPSDLLAYGEQYGTATGGGYQGNRWSPKVLKRLQTAMLAVNARFGSNPNFAGVCTQETSTSGAVGGSNTNYTVSLGATLGNYSGNDAYSAANYEAALICEMDILANALPNTRQKAYVNFISGAPQGSNINGTGEQDILLRLAIHAQTKGVMWGGPDMCTPSGAGSASSVTSRCYPTYFKYHNGTNGVAKPSLTFCSVQNSEWTGQTPPVGPGGTPADMRLLFNMALNSNVSYPAQPAPLNVLPGVDELTWDWHTPANSNGQNYAFLTTGVTAIFRAFPTFGTVTPNP